jgi:hypothetical protein
MNNVPALKVVEIFFVSLLIFGGLLPVSCKRVTSLEEPLFELAVKL